MQLPRKGEGLSPFPKAQTSSPVKSHAVVIFPMKVVPTSSVRLLLVVTSAWWYSLIASLLMQLIPYIKSIRWGRIYNRPVRSRGLTLAVTGVLRRSDANQDEQN